MERIPARRVLADLTISAGDWPALPEVAICLLTTARITGAVEAFSRYAEALLAPFKPHRATGLCGTSQKEAGNCPFPSWRL